MTEGVLADLAPKGAPVLEISTLTGDGLPAVLDHLRRAVAPQ